MKSSTSPQVAIHFERRPPLDPAGVDGLEVLWVPFSDPHTLVNHGVRAHLPYDFLQREWRFCDIPSEAGRGFAAARPCILGGASPLGDTSFQVFFELTRNFRPPVAVFGDILVTV